VVLTGNDKLRAEGKADQTIGEVKQVADKAVDKVKQAVKNCAAEVCGNRTADAEALPKPALFHQRKG
jgi:uncharacterized protein YjbJ (UPF0337 family)